MKKFAILMSGFVGLAAAPAHAALTIELSLPSGTFSSPSVFCANGNAPCSFSETITFTTPSPYNLVSASITTISVGGVGSTSDINFTSVLLNGTALTLTNLFNGVFEVGGVADLPFVAPGTHTLTVSGITYGTAAGTDGSYSGTFTFRSPSFPPAVPEPATWLSMIMGFGALGFAMRRRNQQARRVTYNFA